MMSLSLSRRRLLLATGASAAGLGALTSCGKDDEPARTTGQTVRVWFMEGSISDKAIALLQGEFARRSPGNQLRVEVQPWDGIVSKLQTSLASERESPDLVETGNTQTATFSSVGAFLPTDDLYEELGGDKLVPSFIEAGRWEGKLFSLPLYAGARGVFYRQDLLRKAGLAVPTTIEEFARAAIDLGKANPDKTPGFSGMYLAAVDINGVGSMMFAGGGEWAIREGDSWREKLTDSTTRQSLERISRVFKDGTAYALDSQASQKSFEKYFNENKVGMVIGTGNIGVKIDEALWQAKKVGVMPLPGSVKGEPGQTFAGGSHISIASKSRNPQLAREALRVIFGEKFQQLIGQDGWVPGNLSHANSVSGAFGRIAAEIAEHSKLTPNTPQWGVASGNNLVRDFWTALAQGRLVDEVTGEYGPKFEKVLNG